MKASRDPPRFGAVRQYCTPVTREELTGVHKNRKGNKMLIKAGVSIARLERNTRWGLRVVEDVFAAHKQKMIVTSTDEGNHGAGSLHYANQAFDVRLFDEDRAAMSTEIKAGLGKDFDLVLEFDHWHIEYDPK